MLRLALSVLLAALVLSPRAEKHVRERHCPGGRNTRGKSLFYDCETLGALLEDAAKSKPARQKNGRDKRVTKTAKPVGTDGRTAKPLKSFVTITEPDGAVVTMYPGR